MDKNIFSSTFAFMSIRTRFAPSPTGGLHLGGVRTALFSYLYAKKFNGQFVLRIEDTDHTRFVEGAEEYIMNTLAWCGISPDESPSHGGPYAPYRQSERKETYAQYALQLIQSGHAYYAFDTPEELELMRSRLKSESNPSPMYDGRTRMQMKNSLTLPPDEVEKLLATNTPYVIRIKMPQDERVAFHDLIRGDVSFDTNLVDDKVLLKADGMPTYHLAVVVDDYLMKITHAFRGEEWLPSAPVHLLLWEYLGWKEAMPQWAHLPLILKPDGHGKLSKRDGDRLGFPVFAMDWTDPRTNESTIGFKERGFLPQAFINMLAMLGWASGTEQEIFTMDELIQSFDITHVHKGGAKFDFEKAKWFNQQWIHQLPIEEYILTVQEILKAHDIHADLHSLRTILPLVKDRCTTLNDFVEQVSYFYKEPKTFDREAIASKWNDAKRDFFSHLIQSFNALSVWDAEEIESVFKKNCEQLNLKPGEVQLPMRIMLVGAKFGPAVFQIAELIGKEQTITRIQNIMSAL